MPPLIQKLEGLIQVLHENEHGQRTRDEELSVRSLCVLNDGGAGGGGGGWTGVGHGQCLKALGHCHSIRVRNLYGARR